jgi:diacylglycerol O-acyltransferase
MDHPGAIHNNHLAAVANVPLYTQVADFVERLAAIRQASREAIDIARASRGSRFEDLLDFLPGKAVKLMFALMDRRREQLHKAYANVVISNVPGPREVLHALDGRLDMVELLSAGNLMDAGSLNITVWSYADNLSFSFYSRKGVLPQPDRLNEHLRTAVTELRDL